MSVRRALLLGVLLLCLASVVSSGAVSVGLRSLSALSQRGQAQTPFDQVYAYRAPTMGTFEGWSAEHESACRHLAIPGSKTTATVVLYHPDSVNHVWAYAELIHEHTGYLSYEAEGLQVVVPKALKQLDNEMTQEMLLGLQRVSNANVGDAPSTEHEQRARKPFFEVTDAATRQSQAHLWFKYTLSEHNAKITSDGMPVPGFVLSRPPNKVVLEYLIHSGPEMMIHCLRAAFHPVTLAKSARSVLKPPAKAS